MAVQRARFRRLLGWLRTVPGKVRVLALLAVLAVVGLFGTAAVFVSNAHDGLQVIGRGAGPQVVATGNLYYALSDMDAQVAGVLLIGKETSLGTGRDQALATYNQRRAEADTAVMEATNLAKNNKAAKLTVQAVLDGLGQYERLVGQALALDDAQPHPAGPPPDKVITLYEQATNIMKLRLLPQAYNLTLNNGTIVRRTYEDKRSAVLAGRWWVLGVGLVVLAILVGLQVYLAAGFRRLLNPLLVVATAGTLVLIIACVVLFNGEAGHLRKAKQDGFDSILALSRARAISNSLNADETRYLLDPKLADTYEQTYLDKAQSIVYIDGGTNLGKYYSGLSTDLSAYDSDAAQVKFLGFFGAEAKHVTLTNQGQAISSVLTKWGKFQQDDQQLRSLATSGRQRDAIALRMGQTGSSTAFNDYDQALGSLIKIHRDAFYRAIDDGEGELSGWSWGLPVAAIVLAGLVLAGVRPRLSEFR
jgi:hypothetical protein